LIDKAPLFLYYKTDIPTAEKVNTMDFVDALHSFEHALYEVVMWVILLPKTLIQVLLRPHWIQPYVNAEWQKPVDERFDGYLSPMLFWFLLGILPYAIVDYYAGNTQSALGLADGDPLESNFLINAFLLVVLPTYYAILLQRLRREPIEKMAVKRLFYIQCYVHTPLALASLPLVLLFFDFVFDYINKVPFAAMSFHPGLLIGYAALIGLWLVFMESVIMRAELKVEWAHALRLSLAYSLVGFVILFGIVCVTTAVFLLLPG